MQEGVQQDGGPDNREKSTKYSVYLAALRATAPVASLAAVGLTVVAYLTSGGIFDPPPDVRNKFLFSDDAAIVIGLLAALLIWTVVALGYWGHTSARYANRRNYNLLREKLDRLETRIGIVSAHRLEEDEWSDDRPGRSTLRVVRAKALELARRECEKIGEGLDGRGMPWVTGLGYIELWHRVHRAEEAMIKVEPYPEALEGAMLDGLRLTNATMANKDTLLKRLNCAIAVLDDSAETCKQLNYGTEPVERTLMEGCSLAAPGERTKPANRAKALAMLSNVRYEINNFRDMGWEGIVNARNRLADTSVLLGFGAYALLGLAIFSDAPHDTITWVITYFLIGALTGLFARAQADWNADTAIDDFGLSTARLLQVPWLSGLAAVGGVLITSVIGYVSGGTLGNGAGAEIVSIFESRPTLLIVAAAFGLAPDLLLRRLQQQVDKYKDDLQSTQSSQSNEDVSRSANAQRASGRPRTV